MQGTGVVEGLGGTIRVLSANLWDGRADPDAFAELVLEQRADVVATQEITHAQADVLSRVLPHGKIEAATGRRGRGMGISLTRPGQVRLVPLSYRNAHVVDLSPSDWPELGAPVEIANVHIASPHLLPPLRGLYKRAPQLRELEAFLKDTAGRPRLLIGDFNATPIWPLYRRIKSHLTDAAVTVAESRGTRPAPTWGPWSRAPRLLRIDHAFVDGLAVRDFEVVPVRGSDHSAIIVEFSL